MTPTKILDLKNEIIYIKELSNDNLSITDKDHKFRILNKNYKNKVVIKLPGAKLDRSNNNIDFSIDGKYIAYIEEKKPVIRIIDTEAKKLLVCFIKHKDDIESLCFSHNGRYIASGGVDGKVFLWNIKTGAFMSRFFSHPDYVSFLKFSPEDNYLISCGFEGSMICTNIHTKARPKKYKQHKSRVTAITFLSEHIVITGSKDGEIVVLNYLNGEVIARFMTPHGEVRGLTFDEKVLFVSGIQKAIAIYSLKDFTPIDTHYISSQEVPIHLDFNEDKSYLIVTLSSGKLLFYNIKNEDELENAINIREHKKAYDIIQENPLLEFSSAKKKFDETWQKTYDAAFKLLVNKETAKAKVLLEPFTSVPKIKNQIQLLLNDFDSFERFCSLINTKKLPAAYSLAEQHPSLKQTPIFLKIENIWEKTFKKAKNLMLSKNDAGTVKLTLYDFNNVPSKIPLIQTLIKNPDVFRDLISGLKEKDFKKLLTIIAKYSYLKETHEYQQAMLLADKIIDSAKQKLKEKDFKTVHTYAKLVVNVPHLRDQAGLLNKYAISAQKFMDAYEDNQFNEAYTILDENPFLIELKEAKELEKRWRNMIIQCEDLAFNADIKSIKETLGEFFTLKSRTNRIGSILKTAYLIQIKKYSTSQKVSNSDIIKALSTYIIMFSFDQEIEIIIRKLRKLRNLELDLGEKEMEFKGDDVWLNRTNGNVPYNILKR